MIPTSFWLHELTLAPSENGLSDLEIAFGSESEVSGRVRFERVRNLRLTLPGGVPHYLFGVFLDDVRDAQWEGVRYRLVQAEQDCVELLCASVQPLPSGDD